MWLIFAQFQSEQNNGAEIASFREMSRSYSKARIRWNKACSAISNQNGIKVKPERAFEILLISLGFAANLHAG